jgi:DMSO/TMAO reductase YedYZ molybdopterin-dependent catalytic subunit
MPPHPPYGQETGPAHGRSRRRSCNRRQRRSRRPDRLSGTEVHPWQNPSFHADSAVAASHPTSRRASLPASISNRAFPSFQSARRHTNTAIWDLRVDGDVDTPRTWTWENFRALPSESITVDIHCVTKWSKLDSHWQGVSLDALLAAGGPQRYHTGDLIAYYEGGYTTNLPLADATDGKAWIAFG